MRRSAFAAALVLAGLLSIACGPPRSGVVGTGERVTVGSTAPDIPYTTADGRATSVRQSVMIVGFVHRPGAACCQPEPRLQGLARRYADMPLTVVQVTVPAGECPYPAGCVTRCEPQGDGPLVVLCDVDHMAWTAYGEPALDSVFLVDRQNRVARQATLGDLQELVEDADRMTR